MGEIKKFKHEEDKFWVNNNPYMVVGNEVKPMTSICYKEDIYLLKEYLKNKKLCR